MSDIYKEIEHGEEIAAISFEMAAKVRIELRELNYKLECLQRANTSLRAELVQVRKLWKESIDANRETSEEIRAAFAEMVDYRQRNTLNFQLEKMDDYLRKISEILLK